MKPLFSLSQSAKQLAFDSKTFDISTIFWNFKNNNKFLLGGLIETLIQQLYQKHSLLNIKSLAVSKGLHKV